jgi:hypothetical protein
MVFSFFGLTFNIVVGKTCKNLWATKIMHIKKNLQINQII